MLTLSNLVTVNTRALIDKVLARYSSDWTTLRELIQNAADAQATKVSIHFESLPSRTVPVPSGSDEAALLRHTLQHHTVYRVVVSNNGEPFTADDWSRLKRIAEGNPDETKIGAFGVGFYSVFADCEEPFVISGKKTMAFLWKGNSLFTKSGTLPVDQGPADTTFLLNYRNTTSPLPDLLSVCQFLSTSLTFVGLETIELWLDQWNVLTLNKKMMDPGMNAQLPSGIKTVTKEKMMKVVGVVHQNAQIEGKWLNAILWNYRGSTSEVAPQGNESAGPSLRSLFSRLTTAGSSLHQSARKAREAEAEAQRIVGEHVAEYSTASIALRVSTVNVQTYVASSFAKELERATKKPPPKHTRIAILTSGYEDSNPSSTTASGITSEKSKDIFSQILPNRNGRVFIGFPTAQTTGLLCHISAPSVIPTVERESIDLNARYVKTWNVEMLRVAGIACRIAYGSEMDDIRRQLAQATTAAKRTSVSRKDVELIVPRAIHVFNQYNAHESTPSSQVGRVIEEAFWECSTNHYINVLSTAGVLQSNRVRVVAEPLSFLENIPILPPSLTSGAENFIQKLYSRGLISDMSVKDIRTELEARSFDEAQFTEFLKWASNQLKNSDLDPNTIQSLLDSAVFALDEKDGGGRIIALSQIKNFLGGTKIPPDMPMPYSTIPFRFSKAIPRTQLEGFGWEELQIVPWIRFLVEGVASGEVSQEHNIQKTPEFAASVLSVISKQWENLSAGSRTTVVDLFAERTIIPTKLGMRRPAESYFASVKLFDDLPTIEGVHGVKEKVLTAMGVRKTIELSMVFDRLMPSSKLAEKSGTTWSFVDLVQYLVSVRNDIPAKDLERLRTAAICPREEGSGSSRHPSSRLYRISDLFEPKDVFREMGLPVLYWPGFYRYISAEGKFLSYIGLKQYPLMPQLIQVMTTAAAEGDQKKYDLTMSYLLENYIANNYARTDLSEIRSVPVLPVDGKPFPNLHPPSGCFQNERNAILGYPILRHDLKPYALRFGVALDPPIQDTIVHLINNPPTSGRNASEIFGYFAGRLAELDRPLAETIGNAKIVPITRKDEKQSVRMTTPLSCFLGDPSTYGEILDFVDFGPIANSFLLRVGSKEEPNSLELAQMVVDSPARILGILGDKKYLELLRKVAESADRLKASKSLWKDLKSRPCLLAYKESSAELPKQKQEADLISLDGDDLEDEATVRHSLLRRAPDIVIQDAVREYQMFRDVLATAPQDDALETFYQALGVPLLSQLIKTETHRGNVRRDQTAAERLRKHVLERSKLFLHEYGKDIRHDAKWLEKHLSVIVVDSITVVQSLQNYPVRPFREKKSAAIELKGKNVTLYIVRDPDLYEVAYWIAGVLLSRLRQNDVLALEMVLQADLRRLRSKGYNVDRILRQKEHETKLAEEERKKQAAEEERRKAEQEQLAEQERQLALGAPPPYEVATPARARPTSNHIQQNGPHVPGAFLDSPDQDAHQLPSLPPPSSGNALQELMSSAPEWVRNIGDRVRGTNTTTGTPQPTAPTAPANPVSSERNVAQNLVNAVNACRSHNSNSVFNRPSTTNVEEAKGSYCDSNSAQDLSLLRDTDAGIKYYVANHIRDGSALYARQTNGLRLFGYLLLDIASIFNIRPQSLHIFYDDHGSTIAFNESGALFFNYVWFEKLHLPQFETSRDRRIEAVSYWWITMCHELAHNLVKEHSAAHSFYAESFAQQYFGRVMGKCMQY